MLPIHLSLFHCGEVFLALWPDPFVLRVIHPVWTYCYLRNRPWIFSIFSMLSQIVNTIEIRDVINILNRKVSRRHKEEMLRQSKKHVFFLLSEFSTPFIWTPRLVPPTCCQVILWTTLIIQAGGSAKNAKQCCKSEVDMEVKWPASTCPVCRCVRRNWWEFAQEVELVVPCKIKFDHPPTIFVGASRSAFPPCKNHKVYNRHLEMIHWIFPRRLQNLWRYHARLSSEWSTIPWRHSLFVPRGATTYCKVSLMSPHTEFEVFLPVPSSSFADCNNRQLHGSYFQWRELYNLRAQHPNTVLEWMLRLFRYIPTTSLRELQINWYQSEVRPLSFSSEFHDDLGWCWASGRKEWRFAFLVIISE